MKNSFVGFALVYAIFVQANSSFCQNVYSQSSESVVIVQNGNVAPQSYEDGQDGLAATTKEAIDGAPGPNGVVGDASANVLPGGMDLSTQVLVTNGPANVSYVSATATVNYSDYLNFNVGPVATYVTITAAWYLQGSMSSSAQPIQGVVPVFDSAVSYGAQTMLQVNGTGIGNGVDPVTIGSTQTITGSRIGQLPLVQTIPTVQRILLTFNILSQVDFNLTLIATLHSESEDGEFGSAFDFGGQAFSAGDFIHTLGWGGITSVTDADGNPITDWSVTSASGYDYSKPFVDAPEPATFVLLVLAVPGLLFARRRHNR